MRGFSSMRMHYERRSEISSDEIEDFDTDGEGDLYSEDEWDEEHDDDEYWDDEPEEREYCD